MPNSNIAITQVSYLSPDGSGIDTFFQQVNKGSIQSKLEHYDPEGFLGKKGVRYLSNSTKLYCNLAFKCLQHPSIKLALENHPEKFGLYDGSELANLEEAMAFDLVAKSEGPNYVSPMKAANTLANASASLMAIKSGIRGPNFSVCGGATGSLQALDIAGMHIRNKIIDYGIVVSTETTSCYHKAIRRGEKRADKKHAPPFGIGLTLTSPEVAAVNNENIYGYINGIASGQRLDYETNEDTLARLMEGVTQDTYPSKEIDAIIVTGVHNLNFKQLISELWWSMDIDQARVYCPEIDYGISESSGGSVGLLYAMGLANGQIVAKHKGTLAARHKKIKQNFLVCAIDKLGYGMVTLMSV